MASFANLAERFIGDNVWVSTRLVAKDFSGRAIHYIDLAIETDNLHDAFYEAHDRISQIENAIAFLSFGPVHTAFLSLTIPNVKLGEWFDIVLPSEGFRRSRAQLTTAKLEQMSSPKDKEITIALHSFKQGVSSVSPYRVVTDLWTAIETLASKQGAQESNFVEHTCEECGHKTNRGMPKTHPYINTHFATAKAKDKTEKEALDFAKRSGRVRHVLVHGGKLRDKSLRSEAEFVQPSLQAAAATAIAKELDIKTDARYCHHLGLPYIHLQMKRTGQEQVAMRAQELRVSSALSEVPDDLRDTDEFSIDIGLFLPQSVQPLDKDALPDLIIR